MALFCLDARSVYDSEPVTPNVRSSLANEYMPLALGVYFLELESHALQTLTTELWPTLPESGRAVWISTVEPMPPSGKNGCEVLYTSAFEIRSDDSRSNENSRPPVSLVMVRPLTSTLLNSGPRPRTEM